MDDILKDQESEIAASETDAERIDQLKDARRSATDEHNKREAARSAICDKIAAIKANQYPTLEKRIVALEFSDPEMFRYLRKLERVESLIKTG